MVLPCGWESGARPRLSKVLRDEQPGCKPWLLALFISELSYAEVVDNAEIVDSILTAE